MSFGITPLLFLRLSLGGALRFQARCTHGNGGHGEPIAYRPSLCPRPDLGAIAATRSLSRQRNIGRDPDAACYMATPATGRCEALGVVAG